MAKTKPTKDVTEAGANQSDAQAHQEEQPENSPAYVGSGLAGEADVDVDTSKDAHWDLNNRSLADKEKDSGNAAKPKPYGNAPDAGLTPQESDAKGLGNTPTTSQVSDDNARK